MNKLFVIVGPTGIGKTDLSIEVAKLLKTEIISSDSRQIYKEMRIGTAVPEKHQLEAVPHHFIGNISIHDYYNASMFEFEVLDKLKELFPNFGNVLMVGGSMMYVDAVCKGIDDLPTIEQDIRDSLWKRFNEEGLDGLRGDLKILDPEHYEKVDLKNHKRILKALEVCIQTGKPYSSFLTNSAKKRDFEIVKIGLERDREELYNRINLRVDQMISEGLEEEARGFFEHRELNSLNTVGYKELFDYFDGSIDRDLAIEHIKRDTRRYAKKQMAWFKRDKEINWFHPENKEEIFEFVKLKMGK